MADKKNLTELCVGQEAKISNIKTTGAMRRRLFDLGMIEGTKVVCLQKSPSGDPVAYLVRGTVLALRREDSCNILVIPSGI